MKIYEIYQVWSLGFADEAPYPFRLTAQWELCYSCASPEGAEERRLEILGENPHLQPNDVKITIQEIKYED